MPTKPSHKTLSKNLESAARFRERDATIGDEIQEPEVKPETGKTRKPNPKPAPPAKKAARTKVPASRHEKPTQGLKQSDVVAFNQSAERAAVAYLSGYIRQKGAPTFNTACSLIALELDISTETAKRYIRKHGVDHPKAPFLLEDGYVRLRRS